MRLLNGYIQLAARIKPVYHGLALYDLSPHSTVSLYWLYNLVCRRVCASILAFVSV